MSIFYENYLKLCAARQESPTAVSKKIGLSNAAATGWKKGKNPSEVTLEKLAVYFGVAREDLTGEKGKKEKPTPGEGSRLDARFDELLSQMTDADRADLLEYMEFKVAKRKENSNG